MQESLVKLYAEMRAKKRSRSKNSVFNCRALAGKSHRNISINCDMSVSCNCQDYRGEGILGSLRENTLEEIINGERASFFRSELAAGRLPVDVCAICRELEHVPRNAIASDASRINVPEALMIENTIQCNLRCIACTRAKNADSIRSKKIMSLEDLKKVVDEVIKPYGIKRVSYFLLGEPFVSNTINSELSMLREAMPDGFIHTSTNGAMINSPDKIDAALKFDQILFSIDGVDNKSLCGYQRGGSFDAAYKGMCDVVKERNSRGLTAPRVIWKYILFKWNDRRDHIERAVELAEKAGVDKFVLMPTLTPFMGISRRYWIWKKDYLHDFGTRVGNSMELTFNSKGEGCKGGE